MTRRASIRRAVLIMLGMALGKLDALQASGGVLSCNLDQWDHITFTYKKREISVPVSEVFAALQSVAAGK